MKSRELIGEGCFHYQPTTEEDHDWRAELYERAEVDPERNPRRAARERTRFHDDQHHAEASDQVPGTYTRDGGAFQLHPRRKLTR